MVCGMQLGKHKGVDRISHRGHKRLRYWLFQAAESVVAHSEEFKKLYAYYNYTARPDIPFKKILSLIVIACKIRKNRRISYFQQVQN